MPELYQVYLITNLVNDKKYVGQTHKKRGYQARFKEHIKEALTSKSPRRLESAIRHYGAELFKVELIEDNIVESEIDNREQYFIEYFNTFYEFGKGYNLTLGGQGVHGYTHTDTDKQKISDSSYRMWDTLRENADKLSARNTKISESLAGVSKSDEHRQKLRESAIKRFQSEPGTFKGKKHTEETRRLISERARKTPVRMLDKNTGELIRTFDSISSAAKFLESEGLHTNNSATSRIRTICKKVHGQGTSAYGYKWEYLE